ncbi:MAG: beta-ketoacyl synthase N-terminal-like domain-containing protein, partial [Acidobacteriota bacterium]
MPAFEPIAIVGRACTLPGALSPSELWQNVLEGRDLLGPVPEGRWRVDTARVLRDAGSAAEDGTWSDRGGYVRNFDDVFDPEGFAVEAAELAGLDSVFLWTLHTARAALRDAGASQTERC